MCEKMKEKMFVNFFFREPLKNPFSDELLLFFFESSDSYRFFFNYLHDSNSDFLAAGINSEEVFRCTAPAGGHVAGTLWQGENHARSGEQDIIWQLLPCSSHTNSDEKPLLSTKIAYILRHQRDFRESRMKYHTPAPTLKFLDFFEYLANRVEVLGLVFSMAVFALLEDALPFGAVGNMPGAPTAALTMSPPTSIAPSVPGLGNGSSTSSSSSSRLLRGLL